MTGLYHSWTAAVAERNEQLTMLLNMVGRLDSPLREVCYAAAILGRFDAPILAVVAQKSGAELDDCFNGLTGLPFVESDGQGTYQIGPHNRFMLLRRFWQESPTRYRTLNRLAADYCRQQDQANSRWYIATLYHSLLAGQDSAVDRFIEKGIEWLGDNRHLASAEELVSLVLMEVELGGITGLAAAWAYIFQSCLEISREHYPQAIANLAQAISQPTDNEFVHQYAIKTLGRVYDVLLIRYKVVREQPPSPPTPPTRPPLPTTEQLNRQQIRQLIETTFDPADLRQIVFDLNEEYDDIVPEGSVKKVIVLNILNHFIQAGRLLELIEKCATERPLLDWWGQAQIPPPSP